MNRIDQNLLIKSTSTIHAATTHLPLSQIWKDNHTDMLDWSKQSISYRSMCRTAEVCCYFHTYSSGLCSGANRILHKTEPKQNDKQCWKKQHASAGPGISLETASSRSNKFHGSINSIETNKKFNHIGWKTIFRFYWYSRRLCWCEMWRVVEGIENQIR